MKVGREIEETRKLRSKMPEPLGLVPTMGYLHEGHLSLVRQAKVECRSVAVSIFVNPTQFGPTEDLTEYPRDLDMDLQLLEAEQVDLVWIPHEEEMYPKGYQTWVTVDQLTKGLEGAHRPGHFRGVATVVSKLFNVIQPRKAYFGQKDAQQAIVIRRLVRDLNFPIEIMVCPTVREPDGLAMSSRNAYLDPEERKAATVLYRTLMSAARAFEQGLEDAEGLRGRMSAVIQKEPLARQQYISVANIETLEELNGPVDRALLSMAVRVGDTRLIDNVVIGSGFEGAVVEKKK